MKLIREFDDFMSDLSLTQPEQAMIRDFVKKYEKYFKFHDPSEFENSLDKIVDDVMSTYSFPVEKKDDVKNYISSLHDLSDGISVVMTPNPHIIYRKQPDMVQTILI
jgi:hypothetical protein